MISNIVHNGEPDESEGGMDSRLARLAAIGLGGVFVLSVLITLPWRWVDPPTTSFIVLKHDNSGRHSSRARRWVRWDRISPHVPMAIIAAEDQRFAHHHGFDLDSIRETLDEPSGPHRGASTISQQLAKNMYLWPGRSWIRKGLEAYFTVLIEALWPKRRILEVYMNVVEFGPGVFGIAAASEAYFHKPPVKLTPYEAALLAAILPNPQRMSANRPSPYVIERALWVMEQMEQLGGASYLATM